MLVWDGELYEVSELSVCTSITWLHYKENKRDVFGHPLPMGGGTHTFYGAKGSCEVDNNSYCIGIV